MSKQPVKPASWSDFKVLIRLLMQFLSKEHKRKLFIVSGWALLLSMGEMFIAAAVIPYISCLGGNCVPVLTRAAETLAIPVVVAASTVLFLLICFKLAVHGIFAWKSSLLHQQVQRDSVQQLLTGFMHRSWQAFSQQHKTHYFRRCATTAVDASQVTQQCIVLVSSILLLTVLLGLMLWHNLLVALILVSGFLLMNIVSQHAIGQWQKKAAQQRELALQHYTVGMTEAFASFREIRVYHLEAFFLERLGKDTRELASHNRVLGFLPVLPRLFLDFSFVVVLLIVVSTWFVAGYPAEKLIPELIFYAVLARAMLPAMMDILSTRAALIGSIYNIRLILDEFERSEQQATPRLMIQTKTSDEKAFRFHQVSYAHSVKQPVLQNADLEISHPSWVAITGASGIGKSTFMELLCGLIKPQQGDVVHYWPAAGHPKVAYLPQHVALIDGSLADNVIFGFDDGDEQEVTRALMLAQLSDYLAQQPDGLHAPVGADGSMMSGGQRQRLALARALYRKPDLLLLDEATSGLDEALESRCLSMIKQQCPWMTVVYITHRQTNLCFADKVFRIENLQIAEITDMERF